MKISETIERECCHQARDLKPYRGAVGQDNRAEYLFCAHCGQLWCWQQRDGAGVTECYLAVVLPGEIVTISA